MRGLRRTAQALALGGHQISPRLCCLSLHKGARRRGWEAGRHAQPRVVEADGGRVYCGASRQGPLPWVLLLWGLTANRTDPGSSTPIPIAIQPLGFPSPVGLGVTLGGRQSKLNRPTTGNLPVIKKEIEKGYLSDR